MAPPKRKGGRTLPASSTTTTTTASRVTKRPGDAVDEPRHAEVSSTRYTPPTPKAYKVSPPWVPVLMGILLGIGALMIVSNYMEILPGAANNWYLFVGLGLILLGIITATKWE
jgi:hypothetical protein